MPSSPEDDHLNVLNVLCNNDKHRALPFTMAYSHDLTVRVHASDGKIHVTKATEPLYAGDVHTLPLELDPSTIETSARVETSGTEVLIMRENGPWGNRPVWSVLSELLDYVRHRVVTLLNRFGHQNRIRAGRSQYGNNRRPGETKKRIRYCDCH
jgi:hypothetical protein